MSANEHIDRLQQLLERVQSRAAGPRGNGAAHAAAAHVADVVAPSPHLEEEPTLSIPPQAAPRVPSVSPSAYVSEPPAATQSYGYGDDSEVEVSSEVVEVDIDIDEGEPMEAMELMESGAQLVAQPSMPPAELEEVVDEQPLTTQQSSPPQLQELEEVTDEAPVLANEVEEPSPSSARRAIAAEEAEVESAPRHTPPPESGRQVAAAPSSMPPRMTTSVSPASLEGHTLIGGWREPGLGAPRFGPGGGMGGVRVPGPGSPVSEPPPVVQAQASGTRLSPDVTQPELTASAQVASFVGAPPVAKPTTLGELLDLTLSL